MSETVPKERLDEVIAARRAADDKVRELEGKLRAAEAAAGRVTALEADLDRYRALEAGWGDERAILAAGISDPEGVETARFAWGRVPANQRPKGGLGEWLGQRDALPKSVQAYLPQTATGGSSAAQGATGTQGGTQTQGTATGTTQAAQGAAGTQTGAGPVVGTQAAGVGAPYTPAQITQIAADVAAGRQTQDAWERAVSATLASVRPAGTATP